MLRLLSDENFDNHIVRGLLRRLPTIDLIRVQDVGLGQTDDRAILLTHDRRTVPAFALDRVTQGQPMPGVFVVHARAPVANQAPFKISIPARRIDQQGREGNGQKGTISSSRCAGIGTRVGIESRTWAQFSSVRISAPYSICSFIQRTVRDLTADSRNIQRASEAERLPPLVLGAATFAGLNDHGCR